MMFVFGATLTATAVLYALSALVLASTGQLRHVPIVAVTLVVIFAAGIILMGD